MPRKKAAQAERYDQINLVRWFHLQYPDELIISIPNNLVRNCVQARNATYEGLVSGIPDLMIPVGRGTYLGLWIELKRKETPTLKNGVASQRQIAIIKHLNSRGYLAKIIYGFDAAKKFIDDYMKM